MSRAITLKPVVQHIECVCGHNEYNSTQIWKESMKALKSLGYKRKTDKKTKEVYYFRYAFDQECNGHHFDNE